MIQELSRFVRTRNYIMVIILTLFTVTVIGTIFFVAWCVR